MKLRFLAAISLTLVSAASFAVEKVPATITPVTPVAAPAQPQAVAASQAPVGSNVLPTDKDKVSYSIGLDIGDNLKKNGLDVNPNIFVKGIQDALAGSAPLLTPAQRQEVIAKFKKDFMAKKEAEFKTVSEKNMRDGEAYLAANKTKPGVKTLADGLQYKVIKEGTGAQPSDNDEVTVEYEGKSIKGQIFDSSYKRGKPAIAKVSMVIPGWKEALKLMKAGSEWEVYVPANLAYGQQGYMTIGPNEALVFNVKLVSVNKASAAPASNKKS